MNKFVRQHSTKIQQLSSAIAGSVILTLSLNASAEALKLQISGKYADIASCEIVDDYSESCQPSLQDLVGGATFSGILTLTDTGEIDYSATPLVSIGEAGLPVLSDTDTSLTFSGNVVTYSTSVSFIRGYQRFYLSFVAPTSGKLTDPFGSFLGGGWMTGISNPFGSRNDFISVVSANVSLVQPVPEPSPCLGLKTILAIGLGWLIWSRQNRQRKFLN